jgi:hypothetical protein
MPPEGHTMSDQQPGGWQPPPQQPPPGWGSPQPPTQRQRWPPKVKRNVFVLTLLAVALLGALWVWGQPPPDSENTVWVSLVPDVGPDFWRGGKGANGVVVVMVGRRVADLGPFGERVAALVAPADHRLPGLVVADGHGVFSVVSFSQVDVWLAEPLVPRRLDTQAVQRELAVAGFRWLVVNLSVEERSQVLPSSAAAAGRCWGDNGLSCEWRLATAGPPLRFEVRPSPQPKAALEPAENSQPARANVRPSILGTAIPHTAFHGVSCRWSMLPA